MKRYLRLFLVLAVVAGIVTAVCFLTDPLDKNPDPSDVTSQTAEKFLKGDISATNKEGRKVSIQDYIRSDYNKYALYDMSGDAVPELIIKTGEGLTIFSVNEQGLTVWYQGTIYEKPLNNRAIFYERPGAAPEHTDYQYIVLDHNGEKSQETSFSEYHGDNAEYFINGEKVSKTAYEDLYKSFNLSDDAIVWKDILPISNKDQQSQDSTTEDLGAAESALLSVLQNKSTFVTAKGATVSLKDYKPVYKYPETADYYEETDVFVPRDYTFVDLDGDGKRELIVTEAPYAESYLILRQENQSIYGYSLEVRWIQSLKQDGSFQSSGGALIHNYNTISFSKNTYQMSTVAKFYFEADTKKPVADKYGYAPDYEKSVFEINGKPVSFEEIKQFAEEWDNRPGAVWVQFSDTIGGTTETTKFPTEAYADFLNRYATEKVLYFTKDVDNNGTEELFLRQNTALEVYTYEGSVKKVGAHDFITGTLLLHHTNDNKYPGIVYVTVGGGKNHFGYITITDGALSVRQTFDDDYGMVSGKKEDVFYTQDEDLITVSRKAYQDVNRIGYSVWEPKTTEDPYAIREIRDDRIIVGENYQAYRDSFISLNFPLGWKCLEQWGEDGRFIYFQDPALGEDCQLSIYFAGATIYTYDYTREDYMAHLTGYCEYEDVVIDSFAEETIQGFPCAKIAYSYTEDNTRFVGTRYDDLIEESRLYHITITYPAAESKTYEKEFAAIIESLRFVKSNG